MTKNRAPTLVYLDPGMHPRLEVKGLIRQNLTSTDLRLGLLMYKDGSRAERVHADTQLRFSAAAIIDVSFVPVHEVNA